MSELVLKSLEKPKLCNDDYTKIMKVTFDCGFLGNETWLLCVFCNELEVFKKHRIVSEHVKVVTKTNDIVISYAPQPRKNIKGSLRHQTFRRDNYTCCECGITNKETILHIDHIVPVKRGGKNELDNLQTLCSKCNISKSTDIWASSKRQNSASNKPNPTEVSHDK